ncbi:CoA-binding protein [Maribacter polysaccharolyticus]|uniref:CoA-binding protein n=1 Tax=Maribacter polysaccharolyticus TaxID=3020831 RepID=UPI00237FB811|nr:CoA-binding protein [Maribacter polysaccharolyticus]MDE3741372.1 CoA-binding protein [Maribacter polysaccharolyticus]
MKDTLVFGASLKPDRYSNLAIERLVGKKIATQAYGIQVGVIHGVQIKTNLNDFQNIHTITLYLNAKRQKEYYNDIINLRPKRVIFNPGTENPEFYGLLEKNGIEVTVACTLVLLAIDKY